MVCGMASTKSANWVKIKLKTMKKTFRSKIVRMTLNISCTWLNWLALKWLKTTFGQEPQQFNDQKLWSTLLRKRTLSFKLSFQESRRKNSALLKLPELWKIDAHATSPMPFQESRRNHNRALLKLPEPSKVEARATSPFCVKFTLLSLGE